MIATLIRYSLIPHICTFGALVVGSELFRTLELPWLDNARNLSCIPPGEYEVEYMERSASGKYRGCYHIKNVPGRSEILIHNGNLPAHTRGCVIIGKKTGTLTGIPAVLNSVSALREMNYVAPKKFTLRVI